MRKPKEYIAVCFVIVLTLVFWGLALHEAQWLKSEYMGVSVRMHSGAIAGKALDALAKGDEAPLSLSAWNRKSGVAINEGLGASAKVKIICVYGNMADVCPMEPTYGSLPPTVDSAGCVIDEKTAQSLFRGLDAVGARLCAGEKTYIVRAVTRSLEPMLLIRDALAEYDNIELRFTDVENAAANASKLLYAHNVTADYTLVENGFYSKAVAGLSGLPAFIIAGAIVFSILRQAFLRRAIPLQLVLLLLSAAAAIFLLKILLGLNVYWPERFLPTSWSDFAFWPTFVSEQTDYFNSLAFLIPVPKDMQWLAAIKKALLFSAVSSISALVLALQNKKRALPPASIAIPAAGACVCAAALWLLGARFVPEGGYLYALPVWWLFENRSTYIKAAKSLCHIK